MTTNDDFVLCSSISALLSHFWRSFFLQQVEINTETHSQLLHRERVVWVCSEHSSLSGMSPLDVFSQSLRAQGTLRKSSQKECRTYFGIFCILRKFKRNNEIETKFSVWRHYCKSFQVDSLFQSEFTWEHPRFPCIRRNCKKESLPMLLSWQALFPLDNVTFFS